LVALVLCVLLGYFGVHRFYVGKFVTGVIWLLTGDLLGVGYIVDMVMTAIGTFTDVDRLPLCFWD
jgi:TM2 domain-containing membrane protein YozV